MQVINQNLFPTPIMYVDGFLPENLAHDIFKYLLEGREVAVQSHSVLTGNAISSHTANETVDIIGDIVKNVVSCRELGNNINKLAGVYAENLGIDGIERHNSWFNIQHKGSILHKHTHIGGKNKVLISGALYINVEPDGPNIFFENPNPFATFIPPTATVKEFNSWFNSHNIEYNTKIGDMLIFPSWLTHYTHTPCSYDNRIVISFNYSFAK